MTFGICHTFESDSELAVDTFKVTEQIFHFQLIWPYILFCCMENFMLVRNFHLNVWAKWHTRQHKLWNITYHNTTKWALFLALVRCQFRGIVSVRMSTTAELSSFLFSLLYLLHMPSAALVMLGEIQKQWKQCRFIRKEDIPGACLQKQQNMHTFIWIFFWSSSMASCWAALRAARRSSRSL